jgi:F-box-like
MSSSGHRYRIRSPIHSPGPSSRPPRSHNDSTSDLANTSANVDTSDFGSESDADTIIDSGRDDEGGSSTPRSRETSVPPLTRNFPRFAGLHDEFIADQSIAATIPYEIIINIFRFFEPFSQDNYNCLFVCKAWAKCAVENVWFRPAIKSSSTYMKMTSTLPPYTKKTTIMFPYAQFIRRLNLLSVAKELTPAMFRRLECCTQLERLTMGGAIQVTDDAIADVIPNFKRLLALDITGIDLEDVGLSAIAEGCRVMQGLNISNCTRVTDKSITAIAQHCNSLRRVFPNSLNLSDVV